MNERIFGSLVLFVITHIVLCEKYYDHKRSVTHWFNTSNVLNRELSFFSFHFEKNKLWDTKRKREKISTQIIFIIQSTHTKKKKVVKMSIAALLQAAEYLERRDRGKSCLHLIFSSVW